MLDAKLLHPGVNTGDILTAYIAAIRALRVLDESGVILELVCQNLRKYLKTREDTVKCIVQSLLDESANELTDELMKSEGLQLDANLEVIFTINYDIDCEKNRKKTGVYKVPHSRGGGYQIFLVRISSFEEGN